MEHRTEKSSTLAKVVGAFLALLVAGVGGYWAVSMNRLFHDKAVDADALQRLWSYGTRIPMGVVVPANNQWTAQAFAAERFDRDPPRQTSVLILDDHYRGDDETYRSGSGIIGDDLSTKVLCSVPSQASEKHVRLDPVVSRMIRSRCGKV